MNKKLLKTFQTTLFIATWIVALVALVAMIWEHYDSNIFIKIFANKWFLFSLGSFSTFVLGWKYLRLAFNEIFRWHKFGMNIIIVMSTQLSVWFTLYLNLTGGVSDIVEASIYTILFLRTGDLVKQILEGKATSDLESIVSLQPKNVNVLENENIVSKKISEVKVSEIILIGVNEIIPLDGKLISESAKLNTQIINGENDSKEFISGDTLFSGMINLLEPIKIKVVNAKADSLLTKIVKQIDRIQFQKSKLQNNIDKIVLWFAPILFAVAIFGFLLSMFVLHKNNVDEAFRISITVLVAACPCALGIAIPLAIAVGSAKAAQRGIIFNKTDVFYNLKKIKYVAFDKTGTLTKGHASVTEIIGNEKYFPIIGKIEDTNGHTLSRATLKYLADKNISPAKIEMKKISERTFESEKNIFKILTAKEIDNTYQFENGISITENSKTTSYFAMDKKIIAKISYTDSLRNGAIELIKKLKDQNIIPIIISGDNKNATKEIADELKIEEYYFDQTSESKAELISKFQKSKKGICFVGDGLNDNLAVHQSDLSISIVSPTSYAKLESDLTLIDPNLYTLTNIFHHLSIVKLNIIINLLWALSYNFVVIPLAFTSIINPLIGMGTMFLSSILIIINTLFFKFSKWKE
jgi:Cu+-exporting ATPase